MQFLTPRKLTVSPWIFLIFKVDTRLQLKDGAQRTCLAPLKAEVLAQRHFVPRCTGLQIKRLSHYRFKPQTLIQPNT